MTNNISSDITVGFCQYGLTLELSGVLSTSKAVTFVDHMGLSVKTPSEPAPKQFDWFALQGKDSVIHHVLDIKTPSKFVIGAKESYTYNMMFTDNERYAFMKSVISNIISAWQVAVENKPETPSSAVFKEFTSLPITQEIDRILKSLCYWRPGEYRAQINVSSQKEIFSTEKVFTLKEEDIARLKQNSFNIIATTCHQPHVAYQTVHTILYSA